MSGKTNIAWADKVWNPTVGCTRKSDGCDNCYAFKLHDQRHVAWKRGRWPSAPLQYHEPFSKVQILPHRLTDPMHWPKPQRVFVDSMSDLFHPDVPFEFIDRVFVAMALCPWHTFIILTKRPERMREYLNDEATKRRIGELMPVRGVEGLDYTWPLPNVQLGVSIENQKTADIRVPELLATLAAVRIVSYEPALGPADLCGLMKGTVAEGKGPAGSPWEIWLDGLDQVIVGGESGPRARPFEVAWARDMLAQCGSDEEEARVAFYMKQMGSNAFVRTTENPHAWPNKLAWEPIASLFQPGFRVRLRHPHGADPDEWPGDLRVREMPA